jgi:hypothetical protein
LNHPPLGLALVTEASLSPQRTSSHRFRRATQAVTRRELEFRAAYRETRTKELVKDGAKEWTKVRDTHDAASFSPPPSAQVRGRARTYAASHHAQNVQLIRRMMGVQIFRTPFDLAES